MSIDEYRAFRLFGCETLTIGECREIVKTAEPGEKGMMNCQEAGKQFQKVYCGRATY
jgi:hypothetical protein